MNKLTLPALLITVLTTGSALAQSTEKRVFVLPHVLEASGKTATPPAPPQSEVVAPRDCASGQATGKMVATYDLKAAKGARGAAPSCEHAINTKGTGANNGREIAPAAPSAAQARHHELTGHVTLIK